MDKIESYLNHLQEIDPITLTTVAATAGVINAINFGVRTYKDYLTKNARRCSGLPKDEKTICMLKLKAIAKQKQAQTVKDKAKCSRTKNPQKCMSKLLNKVKELQQDAQIFQKRAKELTKKI